jgi:hypothetical protein
LNHVLGLLKVAGKRQSRTEGRVLETSREFDEGDDLTTTRSTYQLGVVHSGLLSSKVPEKGDGL